MKDARNSPWDATSDQLLTTLWHDKGMSVRAIATHLGRSENAISMRARNVLKLGERNGSRSDDNRSVGVELTSPDQVFQAIRPPAAFNIGEPDSMEIGERIRRDQIVATYLSDTQGLSAAAILDWWDSQQSDDERSGGMALRQMKPGDLFRAFLGWYAGDPLPFRKHEEDWPWYEALFGSRPHNSPSLVRDEKGRRIPWA